jgi:hypothetical protein
MFKISILLIMVFLLFCCSADKSKTEVKEVNISQSIVVPDKPIALFNGTDLNNWTRIVADSTADVNAIWTINDSVIHCTGAVNGYIRTNNAYKNYRLSVEWRWPAEPGNSGVLLHMNGDDMVWPKCIEAQLKSENAGDFYLINGTTMNEQVDPENRRVPKKEESSENAPGEWNRYEITCSDSTITLMVNGKLQNTATGTSVQSGKICLQSEGKPIEFRKVVLGPLN